MLDIFGNLRVILKRKDTVTDNAIFRLHYLFTGFALVAFSLVITARQYVGQPIDCMVPDKDAVPYINTYCWIHATYSMPSGFHAKIGEEAPYPGIVNSAYSKDKEKLYYSYYQWVCFVLFFQAILFYIPRYLWKTWEGGLMKTLVMGMQIALCTDEEKTSKKKILIDYLFMHRKRHNFYVWRYFFCEALLLVNLVGQMYLLDTFLGGEFMKYGLKVIEYSEMNQEDRVDPMIYVFPRMTKCLFYKYGPSGEIQKHDALCILPLNIVNEKIFIFIWFWFIILTIVTAGLMAYRIIIIALPRVRSRVLHARCRMASQNHLEAILRRTNIGDWFILYSLGKNLDPIVYKETIAELAKRIETNDSNREP